MLPLTLLVDVSMVRISKSYVTSVSVQSRFQKTSDFDLRSRSVGFKLDRDFSQMHLWYESPTLGSCRVVAFTRLPEKMDLSVTFGLLHLWYHYGTSCMGQCKARTLHCADEPSTVQEWHSFRLYRFVVVTSFVET